MSGALSSPRARTLLGMAGRGTAPVILVAAVVMALASFAPMLVRGSRDLRRASSPTVNGDAPVMQAT